MIANTRHSFFLTGKAGSGQTIHSFFGFKFGVLGPGETGTLNPNKIALVRHIDTIIIDEVSMVRCDLIDAMDRTLRLYRKNSAPFGGVQMVFVGDMFQLEPVALPQDREILYEIYGTDRCYFYKANVIRRYDLPKIEFLKIYRQSDRLKITLATNNKVAKRINDDRMAGLDSEAFVYTAIHEGDTRTLKDSVESELLLKEEAQVMFFIYILCDLMIQQRYCAVLTGFVNRENNIHILHLS